MPAISDAKILIIATDGFEQDELFGPRERLLAAGAQVVLASPGGDPIQGMVQDQKGDTITPDILLDAVDIEEYDALVIPGGVANPDTLRTIDAAIEIVRGFDDAGKPIAAICHGPWLLVEADIVEDRTVTSWPSVRTDLENAGAIVVDRSVVVDDNLITSRKPDDVPDFTDALIRLVEEAEVDA
ncbi:MAG TPA: type 1 glutamine amidotransferase domain-containing protein [Sphingomonas sp.]|jgi:protease I|uniref:type 1 glutamine amidotransferase domain-containing protein n=1 Tax=Sphingomonas sp. TaxID=28214 RepID=UPI002EDAA437